MRSLFRYLLRNYAFVLFILLEIISLLMIFNNNKYHKTSYLNSANHITGSIYNSLNSITNYFQLAKINKELSHENATLKTIVYNNPHFKINADTVLSHFYLADTAYRFTSARIINNSINNPHNYITLNKGSKHGIKPDQGIIAANGVVGIVTNVSQSYSVGLSLLNRRWSVSAKLKNTDYFGSLNWQDNDYRIADLMEIPFHVDIEVGDTIITSGYSSVFPEGILIGTIESFDQEEGENYYNIKVKLSTDFKSISFANIIEYTGKKEIKELEEELSGSNEHIN